VLLLNELTDRLKTRCRGWGRTNQDGLMKPVRALALPAVEKWHGGWVMLPHFQGLESCALLVCHRRQKSSFNHERAQRRHSYLGPHLGVSLLRRALCALSWQIDLLICHKRTNTAATHGTELFTPSLMSHPQVFHGGCFGVYGTPPREAFS